MDISQKTRKTAKRWLKQNIGNNTNILHGEGEMKNGYCIADRWESNSWIWLEPMESVRKIISNNGLDPDNWNKSSRSVFAILSNAAGKIDEERGGNVYEIWAVDMSLNQIEERADYSRPTIKRAIRNLIELGLIERIEDGRPGYSTIYLISQKPKYSHNVKIT